MRAIAKGQAGVPALQSWWQRRQAKYPADAYRMTFTANHDSNSWHGSCKEFYGSQACLKVMAMAMLAATLPGTPLINGGQEAFLGKRLAFFEKDPIDWRKLPLSAFYTELLGWKARHAALANGQHGGGLAWLNTGHEGIDGFRRERQDSRVDVYVNLGAEKRLARTPAGGTLSLPPWGWAFNQA